MKKLIIFALLVITFLIGYFVYLQFAFLHIIVKFDDLEPFEKKMGVYFKGFKVGETTKIYPNEDYTNTYLKVKLYSAQAKFPSNISINIKKKKAGGYLNIIFPNNPSIVKLKNNDVVTGYISKDISSILESENFEDIVENTDTLLESANGLVQNFNVILLQVQNIISDNRSNIDLAVKNLADAAVNFNELSSSLNNSFKGENISNSLKNIELTTKNVEQITNNIDETTMPIVNSTLCEVNSTVKNAKEISCGIKCTLMKKMGLARLLFGKPMSNK